MFAIDLLPGIYDQQRQQWVMHVPDTNDPELHTQLSIASFNVWFDDEDFDLRAAALLDVLHDAAPDIITLQEVTPTLLDIIMDTTWIQAAYRLSDMAGSSVDPYGVLILSRVPILAWHVLPLASSMGRQLVTAQASLHGTSTMIASVHLESKAAMAATRIKQLARIFPVLAAESHVILTGDFNFDTHWREAQYLDPRYQDCWPLLHRHDAGFTVDTDRNLMRLRAKNQEKQARFDRIFLHSTTPGWQLEHIALLGDAPISPATPDIFPSDHFGLLARFRWQSAALSANL